MAGFRAQHDVFDDPSGKLGGVKCMDASKTQQNQREEADINVIMRRFGQSGQLPVGGYEMPPLEGDFGDGAVDFQSALNLVIAAERSFSAMDAEVRARFNNDPERFVKFCSDPENLPEMRKLGLAVPEEPAPKEPPPQKVMIVDERGALVASGEKQKPPVNPDGR